MKKLSILTAVALLALSGCSTPSKTTKRAPAAAAKPSRAPAAAAKPSLRAFNARVGKTVSEAGTKTQTTLNRYVSEYAMPLDVKIVSAPPSLEISLTPEVFLRDLTSVVAPAKLTSNGKSVNLSVTTPTVATTTKTTPVVAQSTPAPTPHTAAHRVSSGK